MDAKNKKEQISNAIHTGLDSHHKFMIQISFKHIHMLENLILEIEENTNTIITKYTKDIELLQTIPGVKQDSAEVIIAETSSDMSHFKSPSHLSSWAGLCPGNNESAGKKKVEK